MACTISRLWSVISPPLLFDAATRSISVFSLGKPAASNDSAVKPPRRPASTMRAYPSMLSTMFSSSGKWSPYHSFVRELSALATLSISSSELTACMTCRSELPDISVTFDDDSPMAKSLSFEMASLASDASPDDMIICCFEARASSASRPLSAWTSTDSLPSTPSRASSPVDTAVFRDSRYGPRPLHDRGVLPSFISR